MMKMLTMLALLLAAAAALAQPQYYYNANIYTLDPDTPRAEVMLVEGGLIVGIGSDADVRRAMREQGIRVIQRVDLGGGTVIPGLIDAHGHMIGLGAIGLGTLDLRDTQTYGEVIARVQARAARTPKGEWIVGRGWDHESWPERELPHHDRLSEAVPDHPVWISRVDGHAGLANAMAMEIAGVSAGTESPSGGEILRDAAGGPTGVFVDNAEGLIGRAVPSGLAGTTEEMILKAQEMCLAAGLTGVHDAGVAPGEIDVYKKLEREGRLKIRVYAMLPGAAAPAYFEREGTHDGFKLSVYGAKGYLDGAMGSRGAWLLEPYADRPTGPGGEPYAGLAVTDPSAIEALARHGLEHGYQVCTHAIGDRANREVLDAYERAGASSGTLREARFRVEHAQLLHADDIPRFAKLGVIPSMQPTHCTSDMRWVDARVGPERASGAYVWASLLREGSPPAFGSDFPVESHNPFLGLFAAVTRQNLDLQPDGGWHPDERVTREEALRGFTIDAAHAAFWEERVGTLEGGKLADFLVLDRDVMTCEVAEIPGTRVIATYSFGELVYSAE